MSAGTYLECGIVVDRKGLPQAGRAFDSWLRTAEIEVVPVSVEQARIARRAYADFGKGGGHRAHLNFGDCFAYALATADSQSQRTARAMEWIRHHYHLPLSIDALAETANMSKSSLHHHFKALTAMSPLQYQKQIRLQEARRILLTEDADAATVARRVGYESPSQFSREYRRQFGAPPLRDIARLKNEYDILRELGEEPDVLLRHADQAMLLAKQSGRARYALFDTEQARLTFHRVAYDHQGAAAAIRQAGLPEFFAERLEKGR